MSRARRTLLLAGASTLLLAGSALAVTTIRHALGAREGARERARTLADPPSWPASPTPGAVTFFALGDTGEPGGWDYDVWNEICNRLNCVPVYEEVTWDVMIQAVADGQYDAAADGITITADRAEIVAFSIGYVNIDQRLLVRIGDSFRD